MSLKTLRKVIEVFITIYIWGFIFSSFIPFGYFETYIVKETLAPRPFVEKVSFLYGLREKDTEKVLNFLDEKNIDIAYGFFRRESPRLRRIEFIPPCSLISVENMSEIKKLLIFIFEYLPKKFFSGEIYTPHYYMKTFTGVCNIYITKEIPDSKFLEEFFINSSKNITYRRYFSEIYPERNIIHNGFEKLDIYGFSPRSFYYPGERTFYNFKLYVGTNLRNSLIIIYKDDKIFRIYDSNRAVVDIKEFGNYSVKVYKYKFKYLNYYFGLRFVAYSTPISMEYKVE